MLRDAVVRVSTTLEDELETTIAARLAHLDEPRSIEVSAQRLAEGPGRGRSRRTLLEGVHARESLSCADEDENVLSRQTQLENPSALAGVPDVLDTSAGE